MLPIRDENPVSKTPVVTWGLIAANALIFVLIWAQGQEAMQDIVERFGVVAGVLTQGDWGLRRDLGGAQGAWITPLTSMFLHAGWGHLVGNLWFLHLFGDNVEDTLGRGRFGVLYLLSGLVAVVVQVAVDPGTAVPMIGASGAISGLLAAYALLFPHARIATLVPLLIVFPVISVPAWVFIFGWFAFQVVQGWMSLGDVSGGVAWFAHLGGFVAGVVLLPLLRNKEAE